MRWPLLIVALAISLPTVEAEEHGDCGVYRQDLIHATGRMMRIPESQEERATLYFDDEQIQILITDTDGVTKAYEPHSGGTGIRGAFLKEIGVPDGEEYWYGVNSLETIRPDEPDHFIVLHGDIYWPDCP